MGRYVALLRGVGPSNPNMRNDKLRGVFTDLGFEDMGSVLSSGNIVFSVPETGEAPPPGDPTELERKVETGLQDRLGIPGGTIIRSRDELRELFTGTDVFAAWSTAGPHT